MGKIKGSGNNPNSRKALIPGQVKKGGPAKPGAGRPEGSISAKTYFNKFISIEVPVKMPNGKIENKTIMESIFLSLLHQAQKGNLMAIKEVLDRNFGKEPDNVNVYSHEDALKELDD